MKQQERIAYYEELLDRITAANQGLEQALAEFRRTLPALKELDGYYGSPQWRRDLAADEAGKLPQDLKRGVLSEDGAYDALTDSRRLAADMAALARELAREEE
ncbi:MAG: DUF4298 domain-containing protein [Firmicutes bacterium]|nr:DUF4298 domain-containing protein [Bacillota bacterium]